MSTLSEPESNKRPYHGGGMNGRGQVVYSDENHGVYDSSRNRLYGEEHSDGDFLEIQPEDSASHHGAGENAFFYQKMGNADVMRLDTTNNRRISVDSQAKAVRRSSSEPKLNESETEQIVAHHSSKSMVNFPHRSSTEDHSNWRQATDLQHRNSQSKYVQSPILEETDSALERELHTGSSFYLRPKGLFDFHGVGRNGGRQQFVQANDDDGDQPVWQRSIMVNPAETNEPYKRPEAVRRELERELPYFNNRSSYLRHKMSLKKINEKTSSQIKSNNNYKKPVPLDGDYETESASSNDRSRRNSRSNSIANNQNVLRTSKLVEDDHDSGIALNQQQVNNNRSRFLEKKSIFTIAYDEVATTKIPSATDNLPS